MALNRWRVNFEGNERVDLPDYRNMMARAYADFDLLVKSYIDNVSFPRTLRRYQQGVHVAGTFKLLKDVPRALQDKDQQWLYVTPDAPGSTIDLPVQNSSTHYVEVKIQTINDDLQTRAFWDTDIGLTGEEYFDEINVRTRMDEQFSINQVGFTPGWIPLFVVDTDGFGNVINVTPQDDPFWRPRSIALPAATARDSSYDTIVQDLRTFIDFLAQIISEQKGTGQSLESVPWSSLKLLREYQNIFFSGGGNIEWEGGQGANTLGWSSAILINLAGRLSTYQINAGTVTLAEGECMYVDIPEGVPGGPLVPTVSALSAVPIDPLVVGTSPTILVLFYRTGGKIFGLLDMPELDSGETAVVGIDLPSAQRARLGITSETGFQDYGSYNYITNNQTHPDAIGTLDAALASEVAYLAGLIGGGLGTLTGIVNQDRALKLILGGSWSFNSGTGQLTWSADAYVQVPGLLDNRNKIAAGNIVLASDEAAYVSINRAAGAPATLTVSKATIDAIVPGDNIVVFARRLGAGDVLVGIGSDGVRLKGGESQTLDEDLSDQVRSYLELTDDSQIDPDFTAAPKRTITQGDSLPAAIRSIDTEIDKFFGQLRITPHPSTTFKAKIGGVDKTMLDNSVLSQEMKNLIMDFDGAVINFQTGTILKADDATPLGQNFTPFSIPASQYFWYGVGIVPSTTTGVNQINAQVLITQASAANAVAASAPFPAVAGTKKLGAIRIFNNAGALEVHQVRQLGVGSGGGGSGTGDANSFLEDLKNRLNDSYFDWVTPNIISQKENTLVDPSSTAAYDIANSVYKFSAAQFLLSLQHYGAQFLASDRENKQVELHVQWGTVDPAATYQVSKDGGTTFEAITMDQVAGSKKYRGVKVLADPPGGTLYEYAVANADTTRELNTTTRQGYASKFTVTQKQKILGGEFYVNKTGSPSGDLYVRVYKNNAGVPGELVAEQMFPVSGLSAGNNILTLDKFKPILPAGTYWLGIETSAAYKASFVTSTTVVSVRTDSSAPTYPLGDSYQYNGTTWSADTGNQSVFKLTGYSYDLRVKITASATSTLEGYGVFYGEATPYTVNGKDQLQRFDFDGSLDTTEFTLTKFLPDAGKLKVYDVNTGQVYRFPAFAVQGHKVIFAAGTFLVPGETVILLFDQSEGSGFDNSDANAALLAANHLGSPDATIDRSLAGRGPIVRRPDGTLREITLDNFDNIVILSVP